ncbi:MAG: hypothetical protein HQ581_13330, partial [Planctomycetes bacterium]|nr:hypothetical protein [Planctomycetota bacterium]
GRTSQGPPVGGVSRGARTSKRKQRGQTPPPSKSDKGGRRGKPTPAKGEIVWSDTESLTARAMVLAGDRLVVAGPVDLGEKTEGILSFKNEPEALAAFQGENDICLRVISTADGKTISECKLDALPVFDGMSAAAGKLYLSLKDGSVACFGK